MDARNTSITSANSTPDILNIHPVNVAEKLSKYEEKIKKILIALKEDSNNKEQDHNTNNMSNSENTNNKLFKELVDFDLFLDEELVNRINNSHKLNLHIANCLKENNFPFNDMNNYFMNLNQNTYMQNNNQQNN